MPTRFPLRSSSHAGQLAVGNAGAVKICFVLSGAFRFWKKGLILSIEKFAFVHKFLVQGILVHATSAHAVMQAYFCFWLMFIFAFRVLCGFPRNGAIYEVA